MEKEVHCPSGGRRDRPAAGNGKLQLVSCGRQSRCSVTQRLGQTQKRRVAAGVAFYRRKRRTRSRSRFYGCGVDAHELLHAAVAELGPGRPEELKAFLLALVLGLRRREADLLEWDSFDFVAGTLHIRPTQFY